MARKTLMESFLASSAGKDYISKMEEIKAQDAALAAKKEQATAERKRANRIKIRALRSRRSSLFFEEGRETIG